MRPAFRLLCFTSYLAATLCANAQNIVLHAGNDAKYATAKDLASVLKKHLTDSAVGWAFEVWKKGSLAASDEGGFKITAADLSNNTGLPFDRVTRMHIASVSKSITAIAVAKLVEQRKLNWDDKISKYLPSTWVIHPMFLGTTVKDLLTMKSGLDGNLDAVSSCYDSLKQHIQDGPDTNKIGKFNYQNISYGVLRIIIARAVDSTVFNNNASTVALSATNTYQQFVNQYLFSPCGIANAFCMETGTRPVLVYPFPYNGQHGYITGRTGVNDDGNLSDYVGGLGWYLSLHELSIFLNNVFYKGSILNEKVRTELLQNGFPFKLNTVSFGEYFGTGGDWMAPINIKPRGGIHAYYYFFPGNIMTVVFVNSGDRGLRDLIINSYTEALKN